MEGDVRQSPILKSLLIGEDVLRNIVGLIVKHQSDQIVFRVFSNRPGLIDEKRQLTQLIPQKQICRGITLGAWKPHLKNATMYFIARFALRRKKGTKIEPEASFRPDLVSVVEMMGFEPTTPTLRT